MLYKIVLWMRRIGSVLLDFILMTLSQNWGTHVELVVKTKKDSNSLLIGLRMWFLDFFFFSKKKMKLKETILAMLTVNFMGSQQS